MRAGPARHRNVYPDTSLWNARAQCSAPRIEIIWAAAFSLTTMPKREALSDVRQIKTASPGFSTPDVACLMPVSSIVESGVWACGMVVVYRYDLYRRAKRLECEIVLCVHRRYTACLPVR